MADLHDLTLPVRLRIADGEDWHIGDVTIGLHAETLPDQPGRARVLVHHDGPQRITAQLADLLDATAAQLRADLTPERPQDGAARSPQ